MMVSMNISSIICNTVFQKKLYKKWIQLIDETLVIFIFLDIAQTASYSHLNTILH